MDRATGYTDGGGRAGPTAASAAITHTDRVLIRIARWWLAVARLLAAVGTGAMALVLLVAILVGLVLVPVFGIGTPIVARALRAVRALADLHRREAARILGTPIARPHSVEPGAGWPGVRDALRDLQTARNLVWLGVHGAAGVVLAILAYLAVMPYILLFQDVGLRVVFTVGAWGIGLLAWWLVPRLQRIVALLARTLLGPADPGLASRVDELAESRAVTVDAQAAELRRIERDLHDGAQARLAAVGMTLGLAEQALRTDPDRAAALLEEARADAGKALAELRDLVRGIHPPVLADRGLAGGLEAAAMLCPVPVDVDVDLPARPSPPVESALYFAAAEALSNLGRYAGATRACLRARYADGLLTLVVSDDGVGGADPTRGTGLRGIERRIAAFDGTLRIDSPPGGPTEITMEVPCQLSGQSSPRTTSSSATG